MCSSTMLTTDLTGKLDLNFNFRSKYKLTNKIFLFLLDIINLFKYKTIFC